jgi:pullulanase/glycogen debranching enzyme
MIDATGLQIPGVLDDLYRYDGPLGVSWENGQPVIRVWAPTAQNVRLVRFADSTSDAAETVQMSRDDETGLWSVSGQADWKNQFYLFEVKVFVPSTGGIETNSPPTRTPSACRQTDAAAKSSTWTTQPSNRPAGIRSQNRCSRPPKISSCTNCMCAISAHQTPPCRMTCAAPTKPSR